MPKNIENEIYDKSSREKRLEDLLRRAADFVENSHDEGCELDPEFGEQNKEMNIDREHDQDEDVDVEREAVCTCGTDDLYNEIVRELENTSVSDNQNETEVSVDTVPKNIRDAFEKVGNAAWQPKNIRHSSTQELINNGWLKLVDLRVMYERIPGGVAWTEAALAALNKDTFKIDDANLDCLRKRYENEPMFIILGRDPDAAAITRLWAERRINAGDFDHGAKVLEIAQAMETFYANCENPKAISAPDHENYPKLKDLS